MMAEHVPPRPETAEGSVVEFRRDSRKIPFDQWKAIEMEILKALASPEFGFTGTEYLVLMNLVLRQPYDDPANLSVGDVARITDKDRSNMRKLLDKLEAQRVIGRDNEKSRLWINPKTKDWIPAAKLKDPGVLQHPTQVGYSGTPPGVSQHPTPGVPDDPRVGYPNTPPPGYPSTPPEPPKTSDRVPPAAPLDHGLDLTHEDQQESLLSSREREARYNDELKTVLDTAGRRMAELGYVLPDNPIMPGSPSWHQFKLLLERGPVKKGIDHKIGFTLCELEYLKTFIVPALEDLPATYRGSYTAWSKELNFKLAECRKLGFYTNLWIDEKRAAKGPQAAPVSKAFDAPDFKDRVLTDDEKRQAIADSRARRGK